MEISLTVNYKVEIDKDDFYDSDTGELKTDIEKRLETFFPEVINLSQNDVTIRKHISYYPLLEKKNCLKCAACGTELYIPGKEHLIEGLDYSKMIKDVPFCHSCAWELENEIDEYIEKYNK